MAKRQTEIRQVVEQELRRLGFEPTDFGVTQGSTHQFCMVRVAGVPRKLTFSLTPRVIGRGQIRSDFKRRLREYGWDGTNGS